MRWQFHGLSNMTTLIKRLSPYFAGTKRKTVLGVVLLLTLGGGGALLLPGELQAFDLRQSSPLSQSGDVQHALKLQSALREVFKEVNPSVVRIETEDKVKVRSPFQNDPFFQRFFGVPKGGERKRTGLGSGFIIDKSGYVVTNHHVIGKGDGEFVSKIIVKLSTGKQYNAEVIGSDKTTDLALLKIDSGGDELKPAVVGDSDDVRTGDFAIAIGNPFGLTSTFTMGFISSTNQEIGAGDGVPRIQTDAAINPGNSGGPLLSLDGRVIGINQMIYSRSGGSNGIGFAIPINYAMGILTQLKSGKSIKHGYIGVAVVSDPTDKQFKELNIDGKTGLLVGEVKLGSPAWKAGLRAYDFILEVDGKPAKKFSVLKSAVMRKGPGKTISLKVWRDGKTVQRSLVIGAQKDI